MPIIPTQGNPLFTTTTTAQEVMDAVARDVRQQLSSTDTSLPDRTILLDYVNRVSLDMLQTSRWMFTLAAPQAFVTQLGVTDYYVGPSGQAPFGVYDTKLNLTDFRFVKPKSVKDRSNFRTLGHADESPLTAKLAFTDRASRIGRPALWRQDATNPSIISLYPAPDNQNTYSPQPQPPILGVVPGGALLDRIYFVTVTFVDSFGNESTAPYAAQIYVPANFLLQVFPPIEPELSGSSGIKYDRYNVYATSAGTNEKVQLYYGNLIQQTTLVNINYPWFETTGGLAITGPVPPGNNNVQPINGYVIEFRYHRQRAQITDSGQVLQIPDDYKHTVIAGVDALTFSYLTRPQEAIQKYQLYKEGLMQIVRDLNFISKGGEYIRVDGAAVGQFLPAVESIDLSVLVP